MAVVPYGLYDAFTEQAFGGSQAAIVTDAGWIDGQTRLGIAREFGFPATCFVTDIQGNTITVRFQSVEKEYPMCGHGTICLMTYLIDKGVLDWRDQGRIVAQLRVGSATSSVEIFRREDGRALVMLDIQPPTFHSQTPDRQTLAEVLNIDDNDFDAGLPIETAHGDFTHLVVPVCGLNAMRRIVPDFPILKRFCIENSLETVAVFCRQTQQPGYDIHVRDFCPAVGVDESAAAGTTNAALTSYLFRHDLLTVDSSGQAAHSAEQGLEMNRPSSIQSVVTLSEGRIGRLQVGGVATKILDGQLFLPGGGR